MKKLKTKAEAEAAVKKVRKLKNRFEDLTKAQKEINKSIEANEKKMAAWKTSLKEKNQCAKLVKTLNSAWIKGADKKEILREEMLDLHEALMKYKEESKKR